MGGRILLVKDPVVNYKLSLFKAVPLPITFWKSCSKCLSHSHLFPQQPVRGAPLRQGVQGLGEGTEPRGDCLLVIDLLYDWHRVHLVEDELGIRRHSLPNLSCDVQNMHNGRQRNNWHFWVKPIEGVIWCIKALGVLWILKGRWLTAILVRTWVLHDTYVLEIFRFW